MHMKYAYLPKYQDLGFAVVRARKLKGMTQQDLADAMNVSYETISRIENANTGISSDMLFALSEALETPLYELFRYANI